MVFDLQSCFYNLNYNALRGVECTERAKRVEVHIKLCPHLYTFLSVVIKVITLVQQLILSEESNIIILVMVLFGPLKDYL